MLNIKTNIDRLRQQWHGLADRDWPLAVAFALKHAWPIFMSALLVGMIALHWHGLNLVSAAVLVIFIAGLAWLARQWQAMRVSTVAISLLYLPAVLLHAEAPLIRILIPLMSGILPGCLVLAVLVDFRKTRLGHEHVSRLCWSAVVCTGLLLLFLTSARPQGGFFYAATPMAGFEMFMLCALLCMLFLYLRYQRGTSRVQAEYLALLPLVLTGLYTMALLQGVDVYRIKLPDGRLEHGMIFIHVPLMILAFAMLLNANGFALLRILSDSQWLRGRQNADIVETLQIGLEDYLYQQLRLAVLLLAAGLVSGMWWSDIAWGHYWQADSRFFMGLSVWLYYLAGLHFRLQRGMQMRPFAWWCLGGLPLIIMTLLGTKAWPAGLHNFTGL